ncbi:acyl-CoA dehydrogenase family protein [Streptomyces sp. SAJ15]|uniref:acyl-CoA dehydrogenase family protein n=1 Tax=Streptomyces sp. SAJ15 TaxID=2011095 RepID=UPI001186FCD5|nr:acyl-CoA dehydrogenase family protein [Streptomyces sp. SAJ15]TVL89534.1 acyl-CoA dehydrogenase [Streptomyces sp. SAJ15]
MRFDLDDAQREFARTLDRMLSAADTPAVARAWAAGEHGPGRALWTRLADAGVFALAVPEAYEGVGPLPVELAVALIEAGRHAVPGPLVETVAASALLTALAEEADGSAGDSGGTTRYPRGTTASTGDDPEGPGGTTASAGDSPRTTPSTGDNPRDPGGSTRNADDTSKKANDTVRASDGTTGSAARAAAGFWLPRIASGRASVTLAAPAGGPYALDADAVDAVFTVEAEGPTVRLAAGHDPVQPSFDPARRLARPVPAGAVLARGRAAAAATARATDWAAFATSAQTLGVGLTLLDRTVAYAKQRAQFGRPIGSFQAVKHRLADVHVALEFARPLLYGAAVALAGGARDAGAAVAAAKVAAGEAAYDAARAALQLHGALGYTDEYPLSLWFRKARALRTAWGSPAHCRARVLAGRPVDRPVDRPTD